MRVLIVEDNDDRKAKFMHELSFLGHDLDFAEEADDAKDFLVENVYDVIFLDHDLGGREYVASSDPNTGYSVAQAIRGTENESAYIIIHSLNPAGAQNIKAVLPKAIVAPFTILDIKACVEVDDGR